MMTNPSAGDTVIPTKTSRTTTGEHSSRGRRRVHRVRAESNPGPRKRQLEALSMKTEVPRKNPRHGELPQEVVGDRKHAAPREATRNANLKRTRGGNPSTATSTDSHVHVNSAKIRRKASSTSMDVPGSHSLKSREDRLPATIENASPALKDNIVLEKSDLEDNPESQSMKSRENRVAGKVENASPALRDNVILQKSDLEDVPGWQLQKSEVENLPSPEDIPEAQLQIITDKVPQSTVLNSEDLKAASSSLKGNAVLTTSSSHTSPTKTNSVPKQRGKSVLKPQKKPPEETDCTARVQEKLNLEHKREEDSIESVGLAKDSEKFQKRVELSHNDVEVLKVTKKSLASPKDQPIREHDLEGIGAVVEKSFQGLPEEGATEPRLLETYSTESVGLIKDSEELEKAAEELKLAKKLPEGQLRGGSKVLKRDDLGRLRKTIQWLEEGARRMRDDLAATRAELHEERRAARILKREADAAVREARITEAAKHQQIISELKSRLSQSPSRPTSESTMASSKAEFLKEENHRRELSALRKRLAEAETTVQKLKSNSLDLRSSGKRRKLENNSSRRVETEVQSLRAANKKLEEKLHVAMEAEKSRAAELRAQHEEHEAQLAAMQKTLRSDTIKMMTRSGDLSATSYARVRWRTFTASTAEPPFLNIF